MHCELQKLKLVEKTAENAQIEVEQPFDLI